MKSYSSKLEVLLILFILALYMINAKAYSGHSRIVAGTPAELRRFPWQVIIKTDEYDNIRSGGSIISDNWVLSCGHCIYGLSSVLLIFGTIYLSDDTHNMTSNQVFIHPQYIPPGVNNDISLIKLPTALVFTSTIQPIALVTSSQASNGFVGSVAITSGFGYTQDEYLDPSPVLLWAQVQIIDIDTCNRSVYNTERIADTNICAKGDGNSNMSPCTADSGGALIVDIKGVPVQIGIDSFVALDMCEKGYPSGYIKVSSFLNYISTITGLVLS